MNLSKYAELIELKRLNKRRHNKMIDLVCIHSTYTGHFIFINFIRIIIIKISTKSIF